MTAKLPYDATPHYAHEEDRWAWVAETAERVKRTYNPRTGLNAELTPLPPPVQQQQQQQQQQQPQPQPQPNVPLCVYNIPSSRRGHAPHQVTLSDYGTPTRPNPQWDCDCEYMPRTSPQGRQGKVCSHIAHAIHLYTTEANT